VRASVESTEEKRLCYVPNLSDFEHEIVVLTCYYSVTHTLGMVGVKRCMPKPMRSMSNGRKCGEGGHLQSSKGEARRAEPICSCGLKKRMERTKGPSQISGGFFGG